MSSCIKPFSAAHCQHFLNQKPSHDNSADHHPIKMSSATKLIVSVSQSALRQSVRLVPSRAVSTLRTGTEVSPSVDKAAGKPKLSVNLPGVTTSEIRTRQQYFSNMAPVPAQPSVSGSAMQNSSEDAHKMLSNASDAKNNKQPGSPKNWNRGFLDFVSSLENDVQASK